MSNARNKIIFSNYKDAFERIGKAAGAHLSFVVFIEKNNLCITLAKATPPLPGWGAPLSSGFSSGALATGIRRIQIDISRIASPAQTSQRSEVYWGLVKAVRDNDVSSFLRYTDTISKDWSGTASVITKIANDTNRARAFQKAKNLLGKKIPKATATKQTGIVLTKSALRAKHDQIKSTVGGRFPRGSRYRGDKYLADAEVLASYVKDRQAQVGRVKAGWISAMFMPFPSNAGDMNKPEVRQIIAESTGVDLTKVPSWILLHVPFNDTKAIWESRTRTYMDSMSLAITITHPIGNINGIADKAGTIAFAKRVHASSMGYRLAAYEKAIAKGIRRDWK